MLALADIDLGTLTPEQAAATREALAALETLRAENEILSEERASLASENEAQAERIRRLKHLNLELVRLVYGKRSEKLTADHLKRSSKLFMDETRAPVLDPGRGRTKTD